MKKISLLLSMLAFVSFVAITPATAQNATPKKNATAQAANPKAKKACCADPKTCKCKMAKDGKPCSAMKKAATPAPKAK
ncbi:MAG: hypothetical protein Q8908_02485 [Bacteroidota bacterium]|nr:hypothetical protein [Bacteroidota bacterium]